MSPPDMRRFWFEPRQEELEALLAHMEYRAALPDGWREFGRGCFGREHWSREAIVVRVRPEPAWRWDEEIEFTPIKLRNHVEV